MDRWRILKHFWASKLSRHLPPRKRRIFSTKRSQLRKIPFWESAANALQSQQGVAVKDSSPSSPIKLLWIFTFLGLYPRSWSEVFLSRSWGGSERKEGTHEEIFPHSNSVVASTFPLWALPSFPPPLPPPTSGSIKLPELSVFPQLWDNTYVRVYVSDHIPWGKMELREAELPLLLASCLFNCSKWLKV